MKFIDDYDYVADKSTKPRESKPKRRRGGYVSPLDPPPGDPRAAHGLHCPADCPCGQLRRTTKTGKKLSVIDGGDGGDECEE